MREIKKTQQIISTKEQFNNLKIFVGSISDVACSGSKIWTTSYGGYSDTVVDTNLDHGWWRLFLH